MEQGIKKIKLNDNERCMVVLQPESQKRIQNKINIETEEQKSNFMEF